MPRVAVDGTVVVIFATTIANQNGPTVAELAAGTRLESFLTKDGLTTPAEQNNVADDALADTFDAQVPGTFGGAISMIGKRETPTDTFWDLVVYGTTGFIVVRRQIAVATAIAAADNVEVYPGAWHEPVPTATASNEQHRFTAMFPVASPGPSLRAVVAV